MNNKKFHNWIKKEIETEAAAIEQDAEKNASSDLRMADDSSDDLMSRIRASQGPKRRTFHIRPRVLAAAAAAASLVIALGIGASGERLFTPEVQDSSQNGEFNMASLVIALGIGASGERLFTPEVQDSSQNGEFNMLIFNGDEKSYYEVTEEEAYQEIEERIGIQALRLGYKPQGMELVQTFIDEDMREAQMHWELGEDILTIYENKQGENASFNVRNDGEVIDETECFYYGEKIPIIQIDKGNGEDFHMVQLEKDGAYYYVCGNMDLEQYKIIISEILFKSI